MSNYGLIAQKTFPVRNKPKVDLGLKTPFILWETGLPVKAYLHTEGDGSISDPKSQLKVVVDAGGIKTALRIDRKTMTVTGTYTGKNINHTNALETKQIIKWINSILREGI